MTTGQRIKASRKEKGITQEELGNILGVSGSMIAQYETDKRNPKRETLVKIADALGVYYLDLYGDEETALVKTGVELGKNVAKAATNILTRMEVVAEFESQGYTFEPNERRLVCVFNKLNMKGQLNLLRFAGDMADMPQFLLEPPSESSNEEGNEITPEE